MRIIQILESASVGGMGTGSVATAPSKAGKMIRRQKPTDNALDSGKLFQETNAAEGELDEVAPKGWEGTVKAMKKHKEIDNPWALAHHMKNKGYKSHKKEEDVAEASVEENKKGVRAVKHTVKPRNFVAKNAVQSGAGAHKDKKKAQKQGDTKHKNKEPAYESRLWAALDRRIIK
jgi:hypothetical protein